jgi:hypothetical protein
MLLLPHPLLFAEPQLFAEEKNLAGQTLALKGQGSVYYAGLFHVYDAALYLPPQSPPRQALDNTLARCLVLHYRISLSRQQFIEAATAVLQRQIEDISPLMPRLRHLHAAYRDVQPGDRYALCYLPQSGTELRLNGRPLLRIEGEDFARAYFGIWLAEAAISEPLRAALLGDDGERLGTDGEESL